MSSHVCDKCGNTHDCQTRCDSPRKSQSIPNDTRNARCTVCGDWFHHGGILSHIRSCSTKKIQQLTSDNLRLRKAIDKVPRQDLPEIRKWMIEVIESDKADK